MVGSPGSEGRSGRRGVGVKRTGIVLMPLMKSERRRRGSPASSRSGSRSTTSRIMALISARARLAPRQKCTPPPPKVTWSLGVRRDVERVRVVEHVLVAVGRRVVDDDLVAFLDLLAAELGVAGGGAPEVVDRAAPAEHLLDARSARASGRSRSSSACVGVLDQRQHAVGDEVAGRLVAGDDQRDEEQVELEVVEPVAVDLGLHERGHHVVPRVGPRGRRRWRRSTRRSPSPPSAVRPRACLEVGVVERRRAVAPARTSRCQSLSGRPIISQIICSGSSAATSSTNSHSPARRPRP